MAAKKKSNKKWTDGLFSTLLVIAIIGMNIWFTTEVLEVVKVSGVEPGVLVGAFFGFTTGELWILSSMKKTKDKLAAEIEKMQLELEKLKLEVDKKEKAAKKS